MAIITAAVGRRCALLVAAALLGGCASTPEGLRGEYPGPSSPARAEPEDIGTEVRWGGRLLAVEPQRGRTCFEILSRELNDIARPRTDDGRGPGYRFLACRKGFIDPAGFEDDADITVAGRLTGFETRSIGEYDYRFPVVEYGAAGSRCRKLIGSRTIRRPGGGTTRTGARGPGTTTSARESCRSETPDLSGRKPDPNRFPTRNPVLIRITLPPRAGSISDPAAPRGP